MVHVVVKRCSFDRTFDDMAAAEEFAERLRKRGFQVLIIDGDGEVIDDGLMTEEDRDAERRAELESAGWL